MSHFIENELYSVEIEELGAELRSIHCKSDNYNYMWKGDSVIWGGCSPILFPIVGRLKDGFYRYQGKIYKMEKHGFAAKSKFKVHISEKDSIEYILESSEELLKQYPFPFRLVVRFALKNNCLNVSHTVFNTGETDMWFSIGAHPGFACDIGDFLRFNKSENIKAYRLQNDLLGNSETFLDGQDFWQIKKDSFDNDAYILEGLKSSCVSLERKNSPHGINFHWDSPYLGIWSRPNADFVCLEPWFGVDDSLEHNNNLEEKIGIQKLSSNKNFTLSYTIELL